MSDYLCVYIVMSDYLYVYIVMSYYLNVHIQMCNYLCVYIVMCLFLINCDCIFVCIIPLELKKSLKWVLREWGFIFCLRFGHHFFRHTDSLRF